MTQKEKQFTAAIVIIGNEILSGRTQDTNTSYIASKLAVRGIILKEVRVIADIKDTVIETLNWARNNHDYVFTTGGIGPTHDDITALCVAETFGTTLERNADARAAMLEYYGEEELTEARLKMADIPVGASLIPNPVSGAPGFIMDNVHTMAGVPRIMQAMFDHVVENLEGGKPMLSSSIACTVPESEMAEGLGKLQKENPGVDIGSYPHYRGGSLGLNIVVRSVDEPLLDQVTDSIVELIQDKDEDPIVTYQTA